MFCLDGTCPLPQVQPECPDTPSSVCSIDLECDGDQKCCSDGCSGFKCTDPGKSPENFAMDKQDR